MKELTTNSPEETLRFGVEFGRKLSPGAVVALAGDLGAGKTVLARGICRGLGYLGEVTSPSFVRVHTYHHTIPLYHADFYLLRSEDEVVNLGLDELYGLECIVIVEWAQRFPGMLPKSCWWIEIEWHGNVETVRNIRVFRQIPL